MEWVRQRLDSTRFDHEEVSFGVSLSESGVIKALAVLVVHLTDGVEIVGVLLLSVPMAALCRFRFLISSGKHECDASALSIRPALLLQILKWLAEASPRKCRQEF